ncbi:hypothetical protein GCM10009765_22750 [Fodinicola feengrottensis]|uniref:Tyr recombinase domain-containing protein n=1 Tax=Fodinicola feengrottensis TaxID=435914 RepID=A0ABP4SH37_9ACTN
MEADSGLVGVARLVLAGGVSFLDPQESVFEAMLEGWERQQRVRFLKAETIRARVMVVRRLAEVSNQYPWQWSSGEVEAFFDHARSGVRPIAMSTARGYECGLRQFLEYVTDARYGWPSECMSRFGEAPQIVLHEFNSVRHVSDYEGRPGRRPLTYEEVQALFDAADGLVEQIRARSRKGGVAAYRDAAVLKTVYAFGLRRREAWGLDLVDLRHNPRLKQFGRCGAVFVRWGKASKGSPPKRRTVLLVPEMDWVIDPLERWLTGGRAMFDPAQNPALFVTERRGRMSLRGINDAFTAARDAAGLDQDLDLHCLRHSYITHLVEFGYPARFVQEQVGHVYASTTALYTGVSDEYRNRLLENAVKASLPGAWGEETL